MPTLVLAGFFSACFAIGIELLFLGHTAELEKLVP